MWTDRRTVMTQLAFAFRHFAKASTIIKGFRGRTIVSSDLLSMFISNVLLFLLFIVIVFLQNLQEHQYQKMAARVTEWRTYIFKAYVVPSRVKLHKSVFSPQHATKSQERIIGTALFIALETI